MPKKWDPITGTFTDETPAPERPADKSDSLPVPSLGTSPIFPNLEPVNAPDDFKPGSPPNLGSLPPLPNLGS
jgi:hypothetical protein